MNNIFLIVQREFLTRIKKRSFIIMSILGPILFATIMIAPAYLATMEDEEPKTIAVIDSSRLFYETIIKTSNKYLKYVFLENTKLEDAEKEFTKTNYYAILYIPENILNSNRIQLSSDKQTSLGVQLKITNALERDIENLKLQKHNIDPMVLDGIKTKLNVDNIVLKAGGRKQKSSGELKMVIGYIGGFLIYLFIFMYGTMVMRGVIEEKTNRIVEIIVSSVRPFQLMLGKILGIALVGLTQFALWIVLTLIFVSVSKNALMPNKPIHIKETKTTSAIQIDSPKQFETEDMAKIKEAFIYLEEIDFIVILVMFVFYFIGGYLLYAALFAAIGSAVDSEADTQQFMLPITIPLILAIIILMRITIQPDSNMAFWFSLIPFTAPIIMMGRLPFGVPIFPDLVLSVIFLIITFIVMTWFAGKIYRTGILMYGKKANYKELLKWIQYND